MQWQHAVVSTLLLETVCLEAHIDANSEALKQIHEAAVDMVAEREDADWYEKLLDIMNTAHGRMNRASSAIELNTLRKIYTDASVISALIRSLLFHPTEAIAILDTAIIVAGPYGVGRLEAILDIISTIQATALDGVNSAKINNIPGESSSRCAASVLKCSIPCPVTPPSVLAFQNFNSRSPFMLRKHASHWPAIQNRLWQSRAYLHSLAGPGRVVPVEVGSDYRSDDWQQKIMPWDDFLSFLDFPDQPPKIDSNVYYLAQHDLTKQFPALRDDIILPDYLYAQLQSPDFPDYHPPSNDSQMLFNTWLGPKGTISPAHVDPFFNLYVQVVGYKSVWLAPPTASRYMYPFSLTANIGEDSRHMPSPALDNTSQVDVFADSQDLNAFPDFVNAVPPLAMTATLGPGDVLFFPPGWWHAMRSESTSFSFSMWF